MPACFFLLVSRSALRANCITEFGHTDLGLIRSKQSWLLAACRNADRGPHGAKWSKDMGFSRTQVRCSDYDYAHVVRPHDVRRCLVVL